MRTASAEKTFFPLRNLQENHPGLDQQRTSGMLFGLLLVNHQVAISRNSTWTEAVCDQTFFTDCMGKVQCLQLYL